MAVSSVPPRRISLRNWLCSFALAVSTMAAPTPHAAALQASGKFTEFPLLNPNSGPTTVSIAPDGLLWFTESSGNRIGRMAQDGSRLVEFALPHPGSAPRIITIGSDGNFWFSEHLGNRMGRITKDGTITEFEIPTPNSQPRATALGADGNVWFGEFAGGKIGRITPAGAITEFELPRQNSGPGDITTGADGAMWFVELSGRMDGRQPDGNRVGRITLDGKVTEYPIPSANGSPINIAVGPDRNIWFTKAGTLGRVTPEGTMTEFEIPPGGGPTGLSAGSDRCPPTRLIDRLWYTAGNRLGYLAFR